MTDLPLIARTFGLRDVHPESLTKWAAVHRARSSTGLDVVVKRTSKTYPEGIAAWTSALAAAGLPVVSPVGLGRPNPAQLGEDWWVVYPYVDGRPYVGGVEDAAAAGDLLGRLHAVEVPVSIASGLRPYRFPTATYEEGLADLATLNRHLPAALGVGRAEPLLAELSALYERWWATALPRLIEADATDPLPRTAVCSDYRATNLVRIGAGFVLVDPDNGGWEPRLFELAMAVVLMHREAATAPGRMLSEDEWQAFASAYLRHVRLTAPERELWPLAVDHMLWEEGTWALEDTDIGWWTDPREQGYLVDLCRTGPDRYQLPN